MSAEEVSYADLPEVIDKAYGYGRERRLRPPEKDRLAAIMEVLAASHLGVTTVLNDGSITWTYQPAPVPPDAADPTGEQDQ